MIRRGTIEREFLDLYSGWAIIEPRVLDTGYGDKTYGPPLLTPEGDSHWPAHVEGDTSRMLTAAGEQRRSRQVCYLYGAPAVKADDRITLADGTVSSALTVDEESDERGIHHTVVWL